MGKQEARARARRAAAALRESRRKRDEAVEAATVEWFAAVDELERLAAELDAVSVRQGAALLELSELGVTSAEQAELLGADEGELRKARRAARVAAGPEAAAADGSAEVAATG